MSLEFWANLSVVWLSLLCFIGMLIPLVAVYYAIRGMHVVLGKSRSVMGAAQDYSGTVRRNTELFSQKIAQPIVKLESKIANADKTIRSLGDDIGS